MLIALALSISPLSAQDPQVTTTLSAFNHSGGIRDGPNLPPINDASLAGEKVYSLSFPIFNVYSPNGKLVYHTFDINEIRSIVRRFNTVSKHFRPIPQTDTWAEIQERYPGLKGHDGHYVILSIRLEDCHACSLEEDVLRNARVRLTSLGITQRVLMLKP